MTFLKKIDPEIGVALEPFFEALVTAIGDDPPAARAMYAQMGEAAQELLPPTKVTIEERTINGPNGDVPLVIYQPPVEEPHAGLLWMHGGGYIIGSARDDMTCILYAERLGCTVVSVDYRLAPEHPAPAGLEDCYAALLWMVENADELGIDTERVAIGGGSAGGGLAAGLALASRDRNGPDLAFQLLLYPMIDDTHETSSGHEIVYPRVWNRDVSLKAWKMYLGDAYGTEDVSSYAAPARATDLSNLPPAYIGVGTMDLFRDEDIDYAKRLMAAGVRTHLEVIPGMYHAGEVFMPTAAISQRFINSYIGILARALAKQEQAEAAS